MKSWKKPTPDQVERAVASMGRSGHYRYFFDRLENPEWIESLCDKGFFKNPPKLIRDDEKGTIAFPFWPESRYLARMAPHNPEVVTQIILQIPETENSRVYEDLVDAVLAMPAEYVARFLERVKKWACSSGQFLIPQKLGNLIVHLAHGSQGDAALELAKILLDVLPDPKYKEKSPDDHLYSLSLPPNPVPRFNMWEYGEILKKNIPELIKATGIRAFDLLCDLLETAVRLSREPRGQEGPDDSSYVWRPAIEDHKQNGPEDLKDMLVSAVRDAAESIAKDDAATILELVEQLESRSWYIFHRIALYLLSHFPEAPGEIVSRRLTEYRLFDDICFRHEYSFLLKEKFNTLSEAQKQIILRWIEEGPDIEEFKDWESRSRGKQPTEDEVTHYRKRWQRDRLAWFHESLPEEWMRYYESTVAELGAPEHPDFSFFRTTWVGTSSPKKAEEIKSMSVSEIVAFLQTWIPSAGVKEPSIEGLGVELTQVVIGNPNQFAIEAERFQGLSPTYIYALLFGFRDAISQERGFEWPQVLNLCQWVISQDQEIEIQGGQEKSKDRKWNSARQAIAELLKEGFKEGPNSIHMDLRSSAWDILQPLTWDSHPTTEYEVRYGGSNMDPATMSLNTTRGQAMHAVVQYALWIRRQLATLPGAGERLAKGFDEMPEVSAVLEEHLNTSREPSLSIRAVYGQWLPWLVLLDPTWAECNVVRIFPESEDERLFWHAAWNTYITFCQPYDNVFQVLRKQYEIAVDRIGGDQKELISLKNTEERLTEHLMVFYWRGKLRLEEVNGLQEQFWQKAKEELRGHAIEFIGRSLGNTEGIVPPEILQRLITLWNRRLAETKGASSPKDYSVEMASFGWWFISKKFEESWAVMQLLEALRISGKIEADHLVLKQLADLVQRMPNEAVQCLECLVKGDRQGWNIYHWRMEIRTILSNAIQNGGEIAEIAMDLIHYLGSRGYLEFRNLLQC